MAAVWQDPVCHYGRLLEHPLPALEPDPPLHHTAVCQCAGGGLRRGIAPGCRRQPFRKCVDVCAPGFFAAAAVETVSETLEDAAVGRGNHHLRGADPAFCAGGQLRH